MTEDKRAALLVAFQFMYYARPYCHVGEGFLDRLTENIRAMKLTEDMENELLAVAFSMYGNSRSEREKLREKAMDILADAIEIKWPEILQ